jgi:L-threonylcarbamoyladenylate synthase
MRILNNKEIDSNVINRLRKASVFIILTDTIYGLSSVFDNKESLKKIKRIKKIKSNRPFILLVSDISMLKKYFLVSKDRERYIIRESSKTKHPTSFVLDAKKILSSKLGFNNKDGIAVRLPKVNFLTKIISEIGKPIISTSCNITGFDFLKNIKDIEVFFKDKKDHPEFLLKDKNRRPKKKASRVIDIRDMENIKIIRN